MKRVSKKLRRVEIVLWIVGVSLLGVAFGDVAFRWSYQVQQERALEGGSAVSVVPDVSSLSKRTVTIGPEPEPVARGSEPRQSLEVVDRREVARPDQSTRRLALAPRVEKKDRSDDLDPGAVGRIEIPRLGFAAIVKEGADQETLSLAVGRVPGSAQPGEVGNMVLAGHRDTFFRPLRRIKVNDRIRMIVPPNTYEYRVQSMRVVAPEETSVLDSNGVEELTLVTCYPFRWIGPAPERFIVSAARIN